MHELSVTESILEIALRHAAPTGAGRISDLYLVIGQLSSLVDDSVQFYWDLISKDTLAEGATLHFRRIPTELLCLHCNHQYQPGPDELTCPTCGSAQVKIVAGEEFYLEAIDVEKAT
jgi:hydrogenase nickel incorporation protein HypA/HybF